MCTICVLFNKDLLTVKEAKKAAWELVNTNDVDELHLCELYAKLEESEEIKTT